MGQLLEGLRAVVTGTSGGIGSAIAADMVSQGADVLGIDRAEEGSPVPLLVADLSETGNLSRVAEECLERLGTVDILVNCAGIFHGQLARDLTWNAYDRTLRVNLHAPVFLMSRLGGHMSDRGFGRIVNVTSIHARLSEPTSTAYDVSKAGLEAATRTLAIELGRFGVLANSVAPGFVATQMSVVDGVDELRSDWFRQIYLEHGRLPLGRAAGAEEIAAHVSFLCSRINTYVTGQTVTIDGGVSARF